MTFACAASLASPPRAQGFMVNVCFGGTAKRGEDYSVRLSNGNALTGINAGGCRSTQISGGSSGFTWKLRVNGDTGYEDDETVEVSVTLPSGAPSDVRLSATENSDTYTITNDDTIRLTFETNAYTVDEGDGLAVKLKLSHPAPEPVTVYVVTTPHTASENVDYNPGPWQVQFAEGATEATFTVPTVQDTLEEGNELFYLSFNTGGTTWLSPGSPRNTTITIEDDDSVTRLTLSAASAASIAEGESAEFTLTVDGPWDITWLRLEFEATGDAVRGTDYALEWLHENGDHLMWHGTGRGRHGHEVGVMHRETRYRIRALKDRPAEDHESVNLTLRAEFNPYDNGKLLGGVDVPPNGPLVSGGPIKLTITDATPPAAAVRASKTSLELFDGGDEKTYRVMLSEAPAAGSTVRVTATSADPGAVKVHVGDGTPGASAVLTFDADNWRHGEEVTVTPVADADTDPETVEITHAASGTARFNAATTPTVTVEVADGAPPAVSFGTPASTAPEGSENGNSHNVTVSLDPAPYRPLTFTYQVGGTATSGEDFTYDGEVTVAAGTASVNIPVAIVDDDDQEGDETVLLILAPGDGYTLGAQQRHTLTIKDNEGLPAPYFASEGSLVEEDAGEVNLTVNFAPVPQEAFTLRFSRSGAADSEDAVIHRRDGVGDGTVAVAAGTASVDIPVRILDDRIPEHDEELVLTFEEGDGYALGGARSHSLMIRDNDGGVPAVTVARKSPEAVDEGTDAVFTVTRAEAGPLALAVTVEVSEDESGGADFVATSGEGEKTATIPANKTSVDFTVATEGDAADEPDGTVTVTVKAGDYYAVGETASATVTVRDDDDGTVPPVCVVDPAVIAEVEGHIAHFTNEGNNPGAAARWGTVLARLEGRAGGINDADLATWRADAERNNWTRGKETLPKVQTALAAVEDCGDPGTAGVTLSVSSLTVEAGGTAQYTLALKSRPANDVVITAGSTAPGKAVAQPTSLTFTPQNWDEAQPVTVTGEAAGSAGIAHTIATGDGGGYTPSLTLPSMPVTVTGEALPEITISGGGTVTEGRQARFTVTRSKSASTALTVKLAVSEPAGQDFVAAGNEGDKTVTIPAHGTQAEYTVKTENDNDDEPSGRVIVTIKAGTGYKVGNPAAGSVAVIDNDGAAETPKISIDDVTVKEGDTAVFTVTLLPPSDRGAGFQFIASETIPRSATRGVDFAADYGFFTFNPGETVKTVRIRTFDDAHDEGRETFRVRIIKSYSGDSRIADGEVVGIGTIENADPLPAAWLARFGRTVAEQALDGIAGRMEAPRTAGMEGTLAGQALPRTGWSDTASGAEDATTAGRTGIAGGFAATVPGAPAIGFGGGLDDLGRNLDGQTQSRTMTMGDVLLGSRFTLTGERDSTGGSFALWGRAAQSSFDGTERGEGTDISLDGTVTTGMLGADYARGRWLVGLALMQSTAEGGYAASGDADPCPDTDGNLCDGAIRAGDGDIEASLTAAVPWAAFEASDRLRLWGAAGHGTGEVVLKTATGQRYAADTSWSMAAAGARGELVQPPPEGGPALALTTDALWARTSSEKTRDLAASESDVTRLRLGLEGSWTVALEGDGSLTPKLEVGARHDGGDAETGFGVDLGGGIAWSDPGLGLTLDLEGRTLIAHEDGDLKDRGFAASLAYDPDPATARGPSLSLRQDWGGQAQGGLDALFQPDPLADRTEGGEETARWTVEAAYGFPAFSGRFTGSPHVGLGLATGARDYSLGWRLTPEAATAPDVSFGLKATRRESDTDLPEHTVGIELRARW